MARQGRICRLHVVSNYDRNHFYNYLHLLGLDLDLDLNLELNLNLECIDIEWSVLPVVRKSEIPLWP